MDSESRYEIPFRLQNSNPYAVIPSNVVFDTRLTAPDFQMLARLLCLTGTELSVRKLAEQTGVPKSTVSRSMKSLSDLGYIVKDTSGKTTISSYILRLQDCPKNGTPECESVPKMGHPEAPEKNGIGINNISSISKNNTDTDTDTYTDMLVKEHTLYPSINTSTTKKDLKKEKNCPKNGTVDRVDELFGQFWDTYPKCKRKYNKKQCRAKFEKIKDLESEFPEIIRGLEMWKTSKEWTQNGGEYIPAPEVFLNGERWKGILESGQDDYEQKKKDYIDMMELAKLGMED